MMPRIKVEAIAGRTIDQKRALIRRLTDAVVDEWNVDPDIVTVRIEEVPPENFGRAGVAASDRPRPDRS
jgi:4-oxalocrotonate tautomerase